MPVYTIRFDRLAKAIERGVNESVKAIAIAVDQAVVSSTRVDTGRARSNWLVSLGKSNKKSIDPYHPGSGGSTEAANEAAALAQAQGVIDSRKLGQSIHITNSVPYIGKLDSWDGMLSLGMQAGMVASRTIVPAIIKRELRRS